MFKKIRWIWIVFTLGGFLPGIAEEDKDPVKSVDLVSRTSHLIPGQTAEIALWFELEAHWHLYWINPGEAGLPVEVKWDLPPGIEVGSPRWPYPHRIEVDTLVNYGYEDRLWMVFPVDVAEDFKGSKAELKAEISWLVCKTICLPGEKTMEKSFVVSSSPAKPSTYEKRFAEAEALFPLSASSTAWSFRAETGEKNFRLYFSGSPGSSPFKKVEFFPEEEEFIDSSFSASFEVEKDPSRYGIIIPLSYFSKLPKRIRAVLVADSPWISGKPQKAIQVDIPVEKSSKALPSKKKSMFFLSLFESIIYAFFGGLILNIMPCVFPVLSIKIMHLVESAREDRTKRMKHALGYTAGIVGTFSLLAGLLFAFRAGGESFGWGFHLQSPVFLALLTFLFVAMALNFFGWFEMGIKLASTAGRYAKFDMGAVGSGILATLIATPCTAPFMGAAVGYAVTQSPLIGWIIFIFLGLGMAFPYILLCLNPQWVKRLPKPGGWMGTVKEIMGFPMLGAAIWLVSVWVQVVEGQFLVFSFLILCFALGLWIWGKIPVMISFRRGWRYGFGFLSVGLVVLSLVSAVGISDIPESKPEMAVHSDEYGLQWKPYSEETYEEARKTGKPVFIDFTASWCISCQFNKKMTFSSEEVRRILKEKQVQLLRADWTSRSENISQALARYGRSGIPLNVLYPPGDGSPPVLLPEVLTSFILLNYLNKRI